MLVKLKENNMSTKSIRNAIQNSMTIKRAPTSNYNYLLKHSITNRIDYEKAHYEAELLLNEEDDSQIFNNQSIFQRKSISFFKFYCHLFDPLDWLFFCLGVLFCIILGIASQIINYLNSNVMSKIGITSEFRNSPEEEEAMKANVRDTLNHYIKLEIIFGIISITSETLGYFFIVLSSSRSFYKFKKNYFTLLLSQEQGWYDSINVFELATKVQAQLEYIELGMGENLCVIFIILSLGLASLVYAFLGSWKLCLILLCLFPIFILLSIILNKINVKGNSLVRQTWEGAGGIAEEILFNIKTIASFANFDYELTRFYEKVEVSYKIESSIDCQIRFFSVLLILLVNALAFIGFVYGRTIVLKDYNSARGRDVTGGDITLTICSLMNFFGFFAEISNLIQNVLLSLASSSDYFNLYERRPEMDLTQSIQKPPLSDIQGKIEFKNVNFYYPSDPNQKLILNGINLNFEAGKKIALIGESGCGKSTVVNLIERLYEITGGEILIDGIDIRSYDIQYLRHLIGYVEQEPILFNRSIRQNIIFGREKYLQENGQDVEQLVKNACDEAYASEFINNLPNGLDYVVGIKGSKLSGGQKQRIAIARAILIKPKILILDEATSALDNKSEKIVQKAIDNISKSNVTTIIIAHRLSTIKNADVIFTLKDGKVYEQGTHEELLQKGGYYADMIRPQLIKAELEEQNRQEEYIRRLTSIKTRNTDEEVHFENREKEISKTPDDISLNLCKLMKELCISKCDLFFILICTILLGPIPPFKGIVMGECINAVLSIYQTIRYDDGLKYSLIFLAISILESFLSFLFFWKIYELGIKLTKKYRTRIMKKYLSLHLSFFDLERNSPGSLLTKLSIDTIQLKDFIAKIFGNFFISVFVCISSLIVGCCYEYRLTLVSIAFLIFIVIITFIRRMTIQSDNERSIQASVESGGIISECVTNSKTIFSYNFKQEAIRLYLETIDYITQKQIRDALITGIVIGLIFFTNFCCTATIYAATKKYILNDTLESSDMSLIINVMTGSLMKIANYMRDFGRIRKAIVAIKGIFSIIETDSLIPQYEVDNINKLTANNITGKIEFRRVYFAYPTYPDKVVLKDVSLIINPGEKVALVGYSGCGKSTIIQLLNRFYDVEDGKGEILIDDINIKNYNLYELRKKIGFVSQEPSIFKVNSINNVRYGNLDATNEQCMEAAKEADALQIVQRDMIQDNIDPKEKAKKCFLSGGQKQKLAISRIFLKNPVILLLDEPTSALDKESELNIEKSLDVLAKNKTTVSIAHRLNTIENYDKIIVFSDGRIKEQGTHQELMNLKKRYYTLYKYSNLG